MTYNREVLALDYEKAKKSLGKLQSRKSFILFISIMLAVSLCLSATSSLMNSVMIRSSGQISIPIITAESGYWQDIQAAVDKIVTYGGVGIVYIPEGTWNFVNVGESWTGARVVVPAGVNILGAATERTSGLPYDGVGQNPNGQVIEWKTVLVIPWDVPGPYEDMPVMFRFVGNGEPDKSSRFSDIKLVGYRSIDPDSTNMIMGVEIESIVNFRVDHCYFENIAGGGVSVGYRVETRSLGVVCGVIDHCYFVNIKGYVEPWVGSCTVQYGVMVYRNSFADLWEEDISKVLGQYTNYSVFIEDCYFEKWRHCVASNGGAHYVFRHNTIKNDYGQSLDAHGWFMTVCDNPAHGKVFDPPAVWNGTCWVCGYEVEPGVICGEPLGGQHFKVALLGTRAVEIYNNEMLDANWTQSERPNVIQLRGGSGVIFNNVAGGGTYKYLVYLGNEARERPEGSKVWCNDIWMWNNTLLGGISLLTKYDPDGQIIEGENYHLHAPHIFNYTPYPYPHPLTLEENP